MVSSRDNVLLLYLVTMSAFVADLFMLVCEDQSMISRSVNPHRRTPALAVVDAVVDAVVLFKLCSSRTFTIYEVLQIHRPLAVVIVQTRPREEHLPG